MSKLQLKGKPMKHLLKNGPAPLKMILAMTYGQRRRVTLTIESLIIYMPMLVRSFFFSTLHMKFRRWLPRVT